MRASEIDFLPPLRIFTDFGWSGLRLAVHHDITGGLGSAIGGAAQGAGAVGAAAEEANATEYASDLEKQSADASLDFSKNVFNTEQQNEAPWLSAGTNALALLESGTQPGGQFTQQYGQTYDPGTFTAPTTVDESNDPGYAFRLQQGQLALERSAAAKGTATGGAAMKEAEQYGQDFASNEYSNVYNRALQTYGENAQTGLNAFNTNYNVWANNQNSQFNRLASIAGLGQTATGQLNSAGTAAAGDVAGTYGNLGNNLAGLATQGGNAVASGIAGAGNAVTSGISNYQNYQLLQQLMANQNGSGYYNVGPGSPNYGAALAGVGYAGNEDEE